MAAAFSAGPARRRTARRRRRRRDRANAPVEDHVAKLADCGGAPRWRGGRARSRRSKVRKCFKMLKMGLSVGAVAQKMAAEGRCGGARHGPDKPPAAPAAAVGPPLKDDPKYAKYFKMLKMGLPKEAVAQKMPRRASTRRCSTWTPTSRRPRGGAGRRAADQGRSQVLKYFKMLKMGLPKGAVAQAMTKDGLDAAVLDMDPTSPSRRRGAGAGAAAPGERRACCASGCTGQASARRPASGRSSRATVRARRARACARASSRALRLPPTQKLASARR